ncbi:hypothetical protein IFM89_020549 [Coptis chinensis]|uniref:Transcription repressor n=1 Tax=Coptis chinensis TaxID=261450 RepID=A0A835LN95_9MAGN|nr:hypothetical protein IFM89_020549 [Coptis chinensis]
MGKKMRMPSLFKNKDTTRPFSWHWPSCKQPMTHSFRVNGDNTDHMFKTVNSVYYDAGDMVTTPDSLFTNSSESASFSTVSDQDSTGESLEMVIRGMKSERLFFEPGATNSILEKSKDNDNGFLFKESVVMAMESDDPYVDFRTSMEEMVEAHGLKDWEYLEELLVWYLKVNGKKNHGFIVGAFVDLLVGLASSPSSSSSSTKSPSFCSLKEEGGRLPTSGRTAFGPCVSLYSSVKDNLIESARELHSLACYCFAKKIEIVEIRVVVCVTLLITSSGSIFASSSSSSSSSVGGGGGVVVVCKPYKSDFWARNFDSGVGQRFALGAPECRYKLIEYLIVSG